MRVSGLRKSFGDTAAVDGLDLDVAEGTIFALLGPNGAGKTTTVQILSTLIRPDAGEVRVGGHDAVRHPNAVRKMIGVTGQAVAVDNLLTGEENLRMMADLNHLDRGEGRRRAADLLERLDLEAESGRPASTYSGGERRRLDLAMTLVGDPQTVFLDEPTTGLDPRSRRTVWRIVRDLVSNGVTILLTTHYLEEADRLADQVALMERGRLVAQGTPEELKALIPGGHVLLRMTDDRGLDVAARIFPDSVKDEEASTLRVPVDGGIGPLRGVLDRVDAAEIGVEDLSIHTPDLDDVFLALTGRTGKDGR